MQLCLPCCGTASLVQGDHRILAHFGYISFAIVTQREDEDYSVIYPLLKLPLFSLCVAISNLKLTFFFFFPGSSWDTASGTLLSGGKTGLLLT